MKEEKEYLENLIKGKKNQIAFYQQEPARFLTLKQFHTIKKSIEKKQKELTLLTNILNEILDNYSF